MNVNPQIFREYDIRGYVDVDLSNDFAYTLGRAYATLAKEHGKNEIGIGFDCRHSSEGYAEALARGLADEGIDAVITGVGPTPQLYFSIVGRNLGGGIQVTGSHNPPDMNGFKMCIGTHTLSGAEIQDLLTRFQALPKEPSAPGKGKVSHSSTREEYINTIVEKVKPHMGSRKLKVVVDAGNGVGGLVGPQVLKALGVEVVELYCEPDGNFPNHHPDPTVLKNIQDLIAKVKETNADFGIGWDGDADRIGVVDEKGEVIWGDMLVLLYARAILKEVPNATIIGDVKCSSRLFEDLKKKGANAVMWKTGHSLIKAKLRELNADLAGEMSGHIFFKHRYFGFDDGLYASARLAEIVSSTDAAVSTMLSDLPPAVSTPEMRVDCPEEVKFKIPELAKSAFSEFEVSTVDGVRVNFPNGWGLVRASNTQPVLVMRFEATNEGDLAKYQELVLSRIEKIKSDLLAK